MIVTNQYGQEFILVYDELPASEVVYTLRGESWYDDRHEGWTFIKEKLKEDIKTNGLKYPLCVLYEDGDYRCTHGGQRYVACRELGLTKFPCIIRYKMSDRDKIPSHQQPLGDTDIQALNSYDIEKIHVTNNDFHILVKDRVKWDPNDYQCRTDTAVHQ